MKNEPKEKPELEPLQPSPEVPVLPEIDPVKIPPETEPIPEPETDLETDSQ